MQAYYEQVVLRERPASAAAAAQGLDDDEEYGVVQDTATTHFGDRPLRASSAGNARLGGSAASSAVPYRERRSPTPGLPPQPTRKSATACM